MPACPTLCPTSCLPTLERAAYRLAWIAILLLAACSPPGGPTSADAPLNSPYPAADAGKSMLYSAFSERPKHLDPARAYSENEYVFIGNLYEPPLQYNYLQRPYRLEPQTVTSMPTVRYLAADGQVLPAYAETAKIAVSEYEIQIKPGIRYQPHPCFAKDRRGQPRYLPMPAGELADIAKFADFTQTGSRELVAADYVYEIRRLASPRVQSPILGLMADYIVGLKDLAKSLDQAATALPKDVYLDIGSPSFTGAYVVNRYTYRIRLKGKYPQFAYWLAMPFFAPVPEEAERFYQQPGMAQKNFTLDWQPVGTGAYYLAENEPNRVMRLEHNPDYHDDFYPAQGEAGDAEAGLLRDAGRRLPMVDTVIYTLEKEDVPYWNKFLQGYYDASGLSSDSFDQAIRMNARGEPDLTPDMRDRGILLSTAAQPSLNYLGFNMQDPVVGGASPRAKLLRQALSIAIDYEEFISIFLNGRGLIGQGPLPPGIFGYREGEAGIDPVVFRWLQGRPVRRSLAEAKALLAAAGYPNGRDAVTGQPLTLYFDTAANGPEAKSRMDWFRKQFARLDIQLVIRSSDYNRFQDKMSRGSEQIFEWGWNADYPDPENFLFLLYGPNRKVGGLNGGGGENAANYQNPEYDRLFDRMKDMDNGPQRQAVIDAMVKIAREDAPWIFAFHPKSFGLRHAWVMNAKPNLMAHNQLKYRRIDPMARAAYQKKWNRPVRWPLLVVVIGLLALIWPAVAGYRRRLRATEDARP